MTTPRYTNKDNMPKPAVKPEVAAVSEPKRKRKPKAKEE